MAKKDIDVFTKLTHVEIVVLAQRNGKHALASEDRILILEEECIQSQIYA